MSRKNTKELELLSAYLDGEVTPAERAAAEKLIERDDNARDLYRRLRRTSAMLGELPRLAAPASVQQEVLSRYHSKHRPGLLKRLSGLIRPLLSPAPAVAFVGTVFVVGAIILLVITGRQPVETDETLWAVGEPDEGEPPDKVLDKEEKPTLSQPPETRSVGTGVAKLEEGKREKKRDGKGVPGEKREEHDARMETYADAGEPPEERRSELEMRTREHVAAEESEEIVDRATVAASPRLARRVDEAAPTGTDSPVTEPVILSARQEAQITDFDSDLVGRAQKYYAEETSPCIAEKGKPLELDDSVPLGNDSNPLFDPATFEAPRLPSFNFIGRGVPSGRPRMLVHGEAHVSKNGDVLYLRLVGQRDDARLINALADRLMTLRVEPARWKRNSLLEALSVRTADNRLLAEMRAQRNVSVFYSFAITINRAH